jgi:hypothetical protein
MWIRLISAPWWVRWLVLATVVALFAGLVGVLAQPQTTGGLGWRWGLVILVAFSLITGALLDAIQQPMRTAYLAAFGDLTTPRRVLAVKALQQGDIPTDPAVLSAAVRVGDLMSALGARRGAQRRRVMTYALPVLYAGIAIVNVLTGAIRLAVFWAVMAVFFVVITLRTAQAVKRRRERLPLLRSAAGAPQGDASEPVDVTGLTTLTRRQILLRVALILVAILSTTAVVLAWERPRDDCRAAGLMIDYIAEDSAMVDPQRIQPGGPPLEAYREWSVFIDEYARRVSAPDVAPAAQVVAFAAKQAVAIVEDARSAPVNDAGLGRRQAAYQANIEQMVAAENELIAACQLPRN